VSEWIVENGLVYEVVERTVAMDTASGHSVDVDAPVQTECTPEGLAGVLRASEELLRTLNDGRGDLVDAIEELEAALTEVTFR